MDNILNIEDKDLESLFSPREKNSHKGTYGEVLCVCGSYREDEISMCGAAYLSAISAYRCGAGIVRIYTHKNNYAPIAANLPEAVYELYSDKIDRERLASLVNKAECVLVGCGRGTDERAVKILKIVLEEAKKYLVIDADALNIMAKKPQMWSFLRAKCVITPHIGEMSRLTSTPVGEIAENIVAFAESFAKEKSVVCVLKDYKTVVSDGNITYINSSGNPSMAKGGSGDVLAGIISGILAQKRMTEDKDLSYLAACGVYLHGRAGDESARIYGEYSPLSRDIAAAIPKIIVKNM